MTRATVRAKRIALNLSQRGVARAVSISQAALSSYESGALQLSATTLDRIGELLGLDREKRARRQLRAAAATIASVLDQAIERRHA